MAKKSFPTSLPKVASRIIAVQMAATLLCLSSPLLLPGAAWGQQRSRNKLKSLALPILIQVLQNRKSPVSRTSASILSQVGQKPEAAIPALLQVLQKKNSLSNVIPSAISQVSTPENTPNSEENTPTSEENTPNSEENTPAPEENTPAPEENTPAPEENTPTPEENTPTPEENTPAPEENNPTENTNPENNTSKSAIPALLEALKSNNPLVRLGALSALGNFDSEATTFLPVLVKSLKDPSPSVRLLAVQVLNTLGTSLQFTAKQLETADLNSLISNFQQALSIVSNPKLNFSKDNVSSIVNLLGLLKQEKNRRSQ
ncbi:MAG: HEAT repeat domain-containing protein [Cyanobacteria bacterium P01_A01_bin.84]